MGAQSVPCLQTFHTALTQKCLPPIGGPTVADALAVVDVPDCPRACPPRIVRLRSNGGAGRSAVAVFQNFCQNSHSDHAQQGPFRVPVQCFGRRGRCGQCKHRSNDRTSDVSFHIALSLLAARGLPTHGTARRLVSPEKSTHIFDWFPNQLGSHPGSRTVITPRDWLVFWPSSLIGLSGFCARVGPGRHK